MKEKSSCDRPRIIDTLTTIWTHEFVIELFILADENEYKSQLRVDIVHLIIETSIFNTKIVKKWSDIFKNSYPERHKFGKWIQ